MNEIKGLIEEKLKHYSSLSNKEVSRLISVLSYIGQLETEDAEQLTKEQLNEIGWRLHKKAQSGLEIKSEENGI